MNLAEIRLRPAQEQILAYRGGFMGISAVPGSGKTWTLSRLAAQIVAGGWLDDEQEVLVVTLVNSAVDNFYRRVGDFIEARGLLRNLGYRVRTLHGLAHDIVRERPDLLQLDDRFTIVDERVADDIREESARLWLRSHPDALDDLLDPEMDENRRDWARRDILPRAVSEIALSLIRTAKNERLSPDLLRGQLDRLSVPLPLAEMGAQIYTDYQRALDYRGAVDFDDLIRLALTALERDEDYLERLRRRWPYILEDEAQDSSRLQEETLKLLAGPAGNWVRVGDPNQAIYETFTTADPRFLMNFIQRPDVQERRLPNSGRSTLSIIDLANYLVQWTRAEHPLPDARDALQAAPLIEPTPPGDPQPNPPDAPERIWLGAARLTPAEEIELIADSLARWLPQHPESTVAVLAPRNRRGFEMADALHRRGLPYEDGLLRSSSATRFSAGALGNILRSLADPNSARKLAIAYQVWRREARQDPQANALVERAAEQLRKLARVEDFVWHTPQGDWLLELAAQGEPAALLDSLGEFRRKLQSWHKAILLPIDQMVLTLAQDLLHEPAELAIGHKLAVLLRQAGQAHPGWRLPELSEELGVIARNERRFIGFSDDDLGFDPERHRGKAVIATMHKAKGLEWERVYLMSVNNYDFPSGLEGDQFISERWFARDRLNLEAEALAQMRAAFVSDEFEWYEEGRATQAARLDYVRERLRLLYVGITRARKELIVTWNSGRDGNLQPAAALVALQSFQARRGLSQPEGEAP
jgi:DNA helicase-2/ATP-dependent DNA helicase PcrA